MGALLLEIMKKALGVSPSQYWGRLFQMGLSQINQKHILAFMDDEKAQQGVEAFNMAGRIADGGKISGYQDGKGWDYLHINNANMASNKSNLFIEQETEQDYQVESDGTIVKTLAVKFKNPFPASNCDLESGGLCLNAHLYRNWIRIYVPKGSVLLEGKGSVSARDEKTPTEFKTEEDLGKTVFEGFITLRPLGSAQLSVKYKLPFKKADQMLKLFIQKQPGIVGPGYQITTNGKNKQQFNLTTDKAVSVKLQ